MMTEASLVALKALRSAEHFQWAIIPIFALVVTTYFKEIGRRNWHLVLAALSAWGIEFFAEMVNALFLHFSGYSALWTIAGESSYLIFVGLNLEIALMFAVAYWGFIKILPADRSLKIMGIPNRWFFVTVNALVCVVIESILNSWGVLVWDYKYWSWPHIWSVFFFAYVPSVIILYWLYDLSSLRLKAKIFAAVFLLDIVLFSLLAGVLKWI